MVQAQGVSWFRAGRWPSCTQSCRDSSFCFLVAHHTTGCRPHVPKSALALQRYPCPNHGMGERERGQYCPIILRAMPGSSTHHFCLHLADKNLTTWPRIYVKTAGKCTFTQGGICWLQLKGSRTAKKRRVDVGGQPGASSLPLMAARACRRKPRSWPDPPRWSGAHFPLLPPSPCPLGCIRTSRLSALGTSKCVFALWRLHLLFFLPRKL